MRLEQEINVVVPFEDEVEKALVNLVHTYNVFLGRTLDVLKEYDINDQHYNILKILSTHYPKAVSVGDIKHLLFNKRGDLTRLLDKLTNLGMVVRAASIENRRSVEVAITDQGQACLLEMDAKLSTQRNPREHISDEEARQLNDLLDKFRG